MTEEESKAFLEMKEKVDEIYSALLMPPVGSAKDTKTRVQKIDAVWALYERGSVGGRVMIWGVLTLGALLTAWSQISEFLKSEGGGS